MILRVPVCVSPNLLSTGSPKSGSGCYFITLRKCVIMYKKKTVVSNINKTKQSLICGQWKPSAESCICNIY